MIEILSRFIKKKDRGPLGGLPPEWRVDPWSEILVAVAASHRKLVVLDDDPTGTQTVHDVAVLTRWDVATLQHELRAPGAVFYILTNSRSLPEADASDINREVALNLRAAAFNTRCDFAVVSRSDSTLRGHFPAEMDALAGSLGERRAAWLLVPFFEAGGRRTIDDVHYLTEAGGLVPVGQTAFARDPVFGYRASNLRAWVEEKTQGRVPAADVRSISLDEIRIGGPNKIRERLNDLQSADICVVNAATQRDLETFVLGALLAEARGGRFLYRTAASFVAARAGIAPRALLTARELGLTGRGGLIVVGSHVEKTTAQLRRLLAERQVCALLVEVEKLLASSARELEISQIADRANAALTAGAEVVIHTSRELVIGTTANENLTLARAISDGLVAIVRQISAKPRYILAKGGITSSDLATKALGVERAIVAGQLLPGVPVWRLEAPARWPDLLYIVFPGNVGDDGALVQAVALLADGSASS